MRKRESVFITSTGGRTIFKVCSFVLFFYICARASFSSADVITCARFQGGNKCFPVARSGFRCTSRVFGLP